MTEGLMLLRDRNTDIEISVDTAITFFKSLCNTEPNCIHLSPADFDLVPIITFSKIKIVRDMSIMKGHLWIGQEDDL